MKSRFSDGNLNQPLVLKKLNVSVKLLNLAFLGFNYFPFPCTSLTNTPLLISFSLFQEHKRPLERISNFSCQTFFFPFSTLIFVKGEKHEKHKKLCSKMKSTNLLMEVSSSALTTRRGSREGKIF